MDREFYLRSYIETDFEVLSRMRNDRDLQVLLITNPRPNSPEDVRNWINRKSSSEDSEFKVIASKDGDTAGFVQATGIDQDRGISKIGIAIDNKWRGKGLFNIAITDMEKILYNEYSVKKVVAEILSINTRSQDAFNRLGYILTDRLKDHYTNDNKKYDVLIYEKQL